MIVKMVKMMIASRADDRDRLMEILRERGVVHILPVDPETAQADEDARARLDIMNRAVGQLRHYTPAGQSPDISAQEAANQALAVLRHSAENQNRLTALYRHIQQLDIWGDARLADIESLKQAGASLEFYLVPTAELSDIQARFAWPLAGATDKAQTIVAVVRQDQADEKILPASAERVDLPARDRPDLQAEAAEIDAQLKSAEAELAGLANLLPSMEQELAQLQSHADFQAAANSGLSDQAIYAVQGWVPKKQADDLAAGIAAAGLSVAVQQLAPTEDDQPPTLVEYAFWAKPIQALFAILGTTPGYREYDLAPFFMIAMPIFTAMLVGDAGYGLIFTLVGALFYGKLKKLTSPAAPQLILVFGVATMAWGILTANYFGITPDALASMGGFASVQAMQAGQGLVAMLGSAVTAAGVLWRSDPEAARNIVMKISFGLACAQLVTAHLRQAIALLPGLKGLAELGWCAFLVGMFGLVWALFFPSPVMPPAVMQWLLIGGGAAVVLMSYPSKNPLKMLGLGLVANIMPMIGTFSDTMSYIRLMAVGLASFYIASAFNGLAGDVAKVSPVLIIASVIILLAAHALNIILCLIAIFAHGVRLNMLEFSNNAGVQWTGHPYAPFADRK